MSATETAPERAWQVILDQLQREMPKATFDNWLGEARYLAFRDGVFTIGVPDAYTRSWLESRLTSTIARGLTGVLNTSVEVRFAVEPTESKNVSPDRTPTAPDRTPPDRTSPDRTSPDRTPTALGSQNVAERQAQNFTSTPEAAWQIVRDRLQTSVSVDNYDRWAQGIRFLAYYGDTFIISLPTSEARDWVEKTLGGQISRMLADLLGSEASRIQFVVLPAEDVIASPCALGKAAVPTVIVGDEAISSQSLTEEEAEVLIKPVRESLREIITRPKSVVLVSAYLLRWLPYLGVDQGWFVLAMRQAFYRAHGEKVSANNCGRTFTVSRRRIARWSGLGDKKTWELLKSLEGQEQAGNFLAWFMQRTNLQPSNVERSNLPTFPRSHAYTFWADMPLTPGDAEALGAWLVENGIRENPVRTLKQALEMQPRSLLPHPAPPPAERHYHMKPNPQTVQDVVLAVASIPLADARYLPVKKLAGDLQIHLQSPSDNILITHYFMLEWLNKLGRIPAWIVTILRDRGYIDHTQGIRRDRIALKDGYAELAQLLGVSERQVESWLPPLDKMVRRKLEKGENPRKSAFISVPSPPSAWAKHQAKRSLAGLFLEKDGEVDWSGGQNTRYEFKVRFEDPLTPEHQEIYDALERLLYEALLTRDRSGVQALVAALESEPIRESHNPPETWSAKDTTQSEPDPQMTQRDENLVREPHGAWSANHTTEPGSGARIARLKALLIKHLNPKSLSEIKQLLQQHLEENAPAQDSQPEPETGVGEASSLWDWEKLLGYSGVPEDVRDEIMSSSEIQKYFLGHAFYGYEHRAKGGKKGIQTPFKYAASRRLDCPPPEYMELAGMPPAELVAVISEGNRYEIARSVSDSAFRVARALRENDFLMVIETAVRLETPRDLMNVPPSTGIDPSPVDPTSPAWR